MKLIDTDNITEGEYYLWYPIYGIPSKCFGIFKGQVPINDMSVVAGNPYIYISSNLCKHITNNKLRYNIDKRHNVYYPITEALFYKLSEEEFLKHIVAESI